MHLPLPGLESRCTLVVLRRLSSALICNRSQNKKINAPSAEGCVEILDLRGGRIDFVPELISKIDALT